MFCIHPECRNIPVNFNLWLYWLSKKTLHIIQPAVESCHIRQNKYNLYQNYTPSTPAFIKNILGHVRKNALYYNLWLNALVEFRGKLKYPDHNKQFLPPVKRRQIQLVVESHGVLQGRVTQCVGIIFLYSGIFDKFLQTGRVSFRLPSVFLPQTSQTATAIARIQFCVCFG